MRTTADVFVGEFTSFTAPHVGETIRCVYGDSVQPTFVVRKVEHVFRHVQRPEPPPTFRSIYLRVIVDELDTA